MAELWVPTGSAVSGLIGLDAILANLDPPFVGVVRFMETYTNLASYVFAWGQVNQHGRPWPGYAKPTTRDELVNWHMNRFAQLHNVDPINIPLHIIALQSDMFDPIEVLIRREKIDVLANLAAAGIWNPLGFGILGWSYLATALHHEATEIIDLIVARAVATGDAEFAFSPSEIADITGFPARGNHIDLLLHCNRYERFVDLWNAIQPQNGLLVLSQDSKEKLCQLVDRAMAEKLLKNNGLNLAHINLPLAVQGSEMNITIGSLRGTVWHLAMQNPNIDFLDFLHEHTPYSIDWAHGLEYNPLRYTYNENNYRYFQKLLSYNADPYPANLPDGILETFPLASNKYLKVVLPAIRDPSKRTEYTGTHLHAIVDALYTKVLEVRNNRALSASQKSGRRRRLMNRANNLIAMIRRGNAIGKPDPRTIDTQRRTALALAEYYGLYEICVNLQPNPGLQGQEGAAPGKGHHYNTRSRVGRRR